MGPRRLTALTALTLLAGLASTIFAPLTAALLAQLGWRHTYLTLAAVLGLITIPAHLSGLRGRWPDPDPADGRRPRRAGTGRGRPQQSLPAAIAAVALGAFTAFAVVVNQVRC